MSNLQTCLADMSADKGADGFEGETGAVSETRNARPWTLSFDTEPVLVVPTVTDEQLELIEAELTVCCDSGLYAELEAEMAESGWEWTRKEMH